MKSGHVTANGLQMFFEVHGDGQPLSSVSSNRDTAHPMPGARHLLGRCPLTPL